ncbi:MAG: hypothetical protein AVDCRST_MAG15-1187, partial [uncultured Rubellimicrobium sp.]
ACPGLRRHQPGPASCAVRADMRRGLRRPRRSHLPATHPDGASRPKLAQAGRSPGGRNL